jgi:GTP-binding protein HflX
MYSQSVRVGEDYLQLPPSLEELKETFMGRVPNAIFISAQQKINIDELRERIWEEARKVHERIYPNWRKPNYFDWTPPEGE